MPLTDASAGVVVIRFFIHGGNFLALSVFIFSALTALLLAGQHFQAKYIGETPDKELSDLVDADF
jgi:hypothetical protein